MNFLKLLSMQWSRLQNFMKTVGMRWCPQSNVQNHLLLRFWWNAYWICMWILLTLTSVYKVKTLTESLRSTFSCDRYCYNCITCAIHQNYMCQTLLWSPSYRWEISNREITQFAQGQPTWLGGEELLQSLRCEQPSLPSGISLVCNRIAFTVNFDTRITVTKVCGKLTDFNL